MPDKDYIYTKISKFYYKLADAYRSDSYHEKIPEAINVCMKQDLMENGDDVIRLVRKIEKKLKPVIELTPLQRQYLEWDKIVKQVEKIIYRDKKSPKKIKGIIGECAERMLFEMKGGRNVMEPGYHLIFDFVDKKYESDFKVPFKEKFSSDGLGERLDELNLVKVGEETKDYYTNQLNSKESAKKVRKKPLRRKSKLDLNEEIG